MGMGGKLLRALLSLYGDNKMCVRVGGGEESEWFESRDVSLLIQPIYGWCS